MVYVIAVYLIVSVIFDPLIHRWHGKRLDAMSQRLDLTWQRLNNLSDQLQAVTQSLLVEKRDPEWGRDGPH